MLDNTKPNKKLGQNFLINEYTINTILEILDIKQEDFVLEVGPGHGALTKNIVKKTKEDLRALRLNDIGGICTVIGKNISKINQLYSK